VKTNQSLLLDIIYGIGEENKIHVLRGNKPPVSDAEKRPDFQVTSCLQNDTTNADFAYIESE